MKRLLSGETKVVGVFGFPVRHSLSPAMHNAAFQDLGLDFVYVPFNVHPDNLEAAVQGVRALQLVGVNVTIPHKESVIRFLDWVSPEAQQISSVNTIHNSEGLLKGYSTDGQGFMESLGPMAAEIRGKKCVVLGAGGSARAIVHALAIRGSEVTVANRTLSRAVEIVETLSKLLGNRSIRAVQIESKEAREAVAEANLLVNCTSVGMFPHIDEQPIPSEWMHKDLLVYDLIYNPIETKLLQAARETGCKVMNGVLMLVHQGAISFRIWTGIEPPIKVMEEAVLAGLQRMP
ncbi:MAG: shikimate dehydrogenase [Armatimonadota bacterium]|nr:shikimate dehydrogenase [Armatimonadota bacterium]